MTETKPKERPILFASHLVPKLLDGSKTVTRRPMKKQPVWRADEQAWVWCPPGAKYIAQIDDWMPSAHWVDGVRPTDSGAAGIVEWCPLGNIGDRLWVRETWAEVNDHEFGIPVIAYKAGGHPQVIGAEGEHGCGTWREFLCGEMQCEYEVERWRPSIHMPRWASRLTLEITDVSVERLQDITEEDVADEGCEDSKLPPGYVVVFEGGGVVEIGANYVHGIPKPGDSFLGSRRVAHVEDRPEQIITSATQQFRSTWNGLYAKKGYGWEENPWVWAIRFRKLES